MWNSESQFADRFEDYLFRRDEELHRRGKGAVVLREYNPGYGRADMVLVVYDIDRLEKRRRQSSYCPDCCELDTRGAYAMAYLTRTRWVSIKRLGSAMNLGLSRARQLVSDLECRGLIQTRAKLVKARARKENWVIDCIETFELKLENWKRALEQAARHLWFASRSYVVMPGYSEEIARRLARNCIEWNVGAILHDAHDNWETLSRPPRMTVPVSHIAWILNESVVSEKMYA